MRAPVVAAVLAVLGAPLAVRADPTLRLERFEGRSAVPAGLHVEVPPLRLAAADPAAGGGAGGGTEPALALVLGIFPGFGLGHYVSHSSKWQTWLLIDVVLLVAVVVVTALDAGVLETLAWVALVVERVIEGIDAFKVAGGRIGARARDPDTALAGLAPPPLPAASARAPFDRLPSLARIRF